MTIFEFLRLKPFFSAKKGAFFGRKCALIGQMFGVFRPKTGPDCREIRRRKDRAAAGKDGKGKRGAPRSPALSPPQTAFGDNGEAEVGRRTILLMGWERWDCRPKPCLGLCPKPHQGPVPGPFLASRCIKPLRAFAAVDRLRRQRRSGSWTENDSLYGAGTLGLPSQTLPGAPPRTPQGALPLDPSSLRAASSRFALSPP